MPGALARARDAALARWHALRARHEVVDHAARAYGRADEVLWARMAGGITYAVFLSLFPLLAVAFAVVALLVDTVPRVRQDLETAIEEWLPGLLGDGPGQVDLGDVASAGTTAGVVGLLTLLWTGTGAVDALRDGLRVVFGTTEQGAALPVRKLRDLLVMVVVGAVVLLSVSLSSVATQVTGQLLGLVGLDGSPAATVSLRLLALGIALTLDVVVLSLLFRLLSARDLTWRQVRGGAVLGAVLLEVLKQLAGVLLASASNPLYATFAVAVGLLLWINYSARALMLAASWVATERSVLAQVTQVEAVTASSLPLVVVPDAEVDAGADAGADAAAGTGTGPGDRRGAGAPRRGLPARLLAGLRGRLRPRLPGRR
ncbi:YihY/virulence factor BrkB family protein [Vallicoccus soli]|uniref:YihY/virulence factor BrkB family protein n=1 Tax=Vallicoccus soli TaxID=2339232 RepID=A0A3A3Z407_9ACTN|nr:YihY/virulence factor BrkB family protein [Vallicoccus soli]